MRRRRWPLWRPSVEAEVDEEIQFHVESRVEDLVAGGLDTASARAHALADFGDVTAVREGLRAIDHRIRERRRRAETWNVVAQEVRHAVRRLLRQPGFSVPAVLTPGLGIGATVVARSMARVSFSALLLGVASGLAVLLSAVGIYSVISYLVARRRQEIGIRMALGARAGEVGRLVLRESLGLAALGIALGVAGAVAGTRLLGSLLYGVSPTDPAVLGGVSALLILLAAAASYAPARRAMRVDPVEACGGTEAGSGGRGRGGRIRDARIGTPSPNPRSLATTPRAKPRAGPDARRVARGARSPRARSSTARGRRRRMSPRRRW